MLLPIATHSASVKVVASKKCPTVILDRGGVHFVTYSLHKTPQWRRDSSFTTISGSRHSIYYCQHSREPPNRRTIKTVRFRFAIGGLQLDKFPTTSDAAALRSNVGNCRHVVN
jgi:hypothetical protein